MKQFKLKRALLSWLLAIAVLMGGVASSAVPVYASETSTETETDTSTDTETGTETDNILEVPEPYKYQWWITEDNGSSAYIMTRFIEFRSRYILFLYEFGDHSYESTGKQYYRLGYMDASGAACTYKLSDATCSLDFSGLAYSDRVVKRSNWDIVSQTDWLTGDDAVIKVHDTVFFNYNEAHYRFNGYVFDSLEGAEKYYLDGDDSGIVGGADSYFFEDSYKPPDIDLPDGDVSDGDVSSGDSSNSDGFDFEKLEDVLEDVVGNPLNQIKSGVAKMNSKLAEIYDYLANDMPSKISEAFSSFFGAISDSLDSIGEKIGELAGEIVDGIGDKLEELFLPDLDSLHGHITTTRGKLGFIDDIQEAGEYFFDFLTGLGSGSPPVITVNLGASTKRNIGNQTVTIDFSWYEPYKPTVDKLIAGIVYVTFIWNLFQRLPDIIQGVGMMTMSSAKIDKSFSIKPTGKKG